MPSQGTGAQINDGGADRGLNMMNENKIMICQLCGKRPATICVNIDINGTRNVRFICEACAEERKIKNNPSSDDIIALVNDIKAAETLLESKKAKEEAELAKQCPVCKIYYRDFIKERRLGCAECYNSFKKELEQLIKKRTKPDSSEAEESRVASDRLTVLKLKRLLQQCVEREDYENAAKYRDKIAELENAPKEVAKSE